METTTTSILPNDDFSETVHEDDAITMPDTQEDKDWYNRLKNMQKGQCIVQGDRIKPNGEFGSIQPALVNVTSFGERK